MNSIEVRKIAYRQSAKDGLVITFAIHPNDMPAELASADIGTRFAMALVEIGDDEKPVKPAPQNRTVQQAGILCGEPLFQMFLKREFPTAWEMEAAANPVPADTAAGVLRQACGVKSRKELATEKGALETFDRIVGRFEMWKRGPG